jgi:hypothetical protein
MLNNKEELMNHSYYQFDKMLSNEHLKYENISKAFPSILVDRLLEAIHGKSKDEALKLHQNLDELIQIISKNDDHHLLGLLAKNESSDESCKISHAYLLGQLSFAQHVAGNVVHHFPDKEFYELIEDKTLQPIFKLLIQKELSKQELSDMTGFPSEDIQKKLMKCLNVGLIDFRSNGKTYNYFLTPLAKLLLKS